MIIIHHVKLIDIKLVFLCSLLTFCIFVLSSNTIHKQSDNNPYGSRQSTHSFTQFNASITNSEIRILNPFISMIMGLLHTYWLDTVMLQTRWLENWLIYGSVSSSFTMATESTNAWFCGVHLWTKEWWVYNLIQLYVVNDSDCEDKYDKK